MHNEFTAVFERDGDWRIAYSPEIPGANGQGRTKEEARESLAVAIALILADRREDGLRAVPPDAERETVTVEWKRSALLQHLRRRGCVLKREGGSHSLRMNPANAAVRAIPRHTEILNNLARKFVAGLRIPETD